MTRFVHPAPIVLHRQVHRSDLALNQLQYDPDIKGGVWAIALGVGAAVLVVVFLMIRGAL